MPSYSQYALMDSDLEAYGDMTKSVILSALVADGTLEPDVGEEWAKTHTIIRRKKGFFRTISNLWRKEEAIGGAWIMVVKLTPVANLDPEETDADSD